MPSLMMLLPYCRDTRATRGRGESPWVQVSFSWRRASGGEGGGQGLGCAISLKTVLQGQGLGYANLTESSASRLRIKICERGQNRPSLRIGYF